MPLPLIALTALLVWWPFSLQAAEYSTINSSIRALGMGDAHVAIAHDDAALFYNPAGLSRVEGINWKVFSLRVGASGYEAYNKIKNLNSDDSDDFADTVQELYGEHVWGGAGGQSIITAPMIGFGVYNHLDSLIKIDNPVYPEIYTSVINDYGYVLGFGAPIGPFLEAGASLKYIKRTGSRVPWGASFIADLEPSTIYDNITGWGTGYGADAGMNVVVPAGIITGSFSAVWRNIGGIKFRSNNPNAAPVPSEDNDITLGAGLVFDLPLVTIRPALDFRYLNRTDLQLTRKINFGIEIGLPLLDIRGGFHEGYYTAGVGVNLGLFQVNAATYGVELGEYPGQIEDRRYALEFVMEVGVGNFSASGSSSRGGKGSSNRSIWGSGRLKQRR